MQVLPQTVLLAAPAAAPRAMSTSMISVVVLVSEAAAAEAIKRPDDSSSTTLHVEPTCQHRTDLIAKCCMPIGNQRCEGNVSGLYSTHNTADVPAGLVCL